VANISLLSDGMPQVPYLVGWQGTGHDTLYPSLNIVNEALGGASALQALSAAAAAKYNTAVSAHINVDDAYANYSSVPNPEWNSSYMCWDASGELFIWFDTPHADPLQGPAYHISKTKDTAHGTRYPRIDEMWTVADFPPPYLPSIHTDAWRDTDVSWELDGVTTLDDRSEQPCGCARDIAYFASRGLTQGCEGSNGMASNLLGLTQYFWHGDYSRVFLYYGKIISGGFGGCTALGCILDTDVQGGPSGGPPGPSPAAHNTWPQLADDVNLNTRLYQLFLSDELMNVTPLAFTFGRGGYGVTLSNGALVAVLWPLGNETASDVVPVAYGTAARMLPWVQPDGVVNCDVLYIYQAAGTSAANQTWTLPLTWAGVPPTNMSIYTITPTGIVHNQPAFTLNGRNVTLLVQPAQPVRLSVSG
jgi:hypothetical protein